MGEVHYPGTYVLKAGEKISQLVTDRAGGFTKDAYPRGATLLRKSDNIMRRDQRQTLQDLWDNIIVAQNDLDFERALAKARVESQRAGATLDPFTDAVAGAATAIGGSSAATGLLNAANDEEESAGGATVVTRSGNEQRAEGTTPQGTLSSSSGSPARSVNLATPARDLPNVFPGETVVIDLEGIIEDPSSQKNLTLDPDDVLLIPKRRQTVVVTGAVARAATFVYETGLQLDDYLNLAGGVTRDGNRKEVLVLRMNGSTVSASKLRKIEPGDMIVVPTRVMVERISSKWDGALNFLRFALTTVATAVVVKAVLDK